MSNRLSKFLDSVNNEEVPLVLITHASCYDGTGAALGVIKYCDDKGINRPILMPMQYGDKLDMKVLADHNVIMTDFSFEREILVELEYVAHDLFVIDHHSSAEKELDGLEFCHFDLDHSGASLTWMLLNNEVPELIKYIEDRDLWTWSMYKSKELSAGLNLIGHADYDVLLDGIKQGATFTSELIKSGTPIVAYQNAIIAKIEKKLDGGKIKTVFFEGHEVPLLNSTHLISEVGNMLTKAYPFSIQYFLTDTEIVFSFRADGQVDLTELVIPKGHPNSAGRGFKLSEIDLNVILNDATADVGKYLIEQLRLKEKKTLIGDFRFSQHDSDYIIAGKYSTVKNGGTYFTDKAIKEIADKGTVFCELCQPQKEKLSYKDHMLRNAVVKESEICAVFSNIICEVDGDAVTIKGILKPTGPKANLVTKLTEDSGLSMAYRGFVEDGNALVKFVTFDVIGKHCSTQHMLEDDKDGN